MNGVREVNLAHLYAILIMPEAKFVAQIKERNPKSATLLTIYKNAIVDVLKSSKIKRFSVP